MRGKLAIGITVNFVNGRTVEETQVPEISGVARIYNQKFFQSLLKATGQGPPSKAFPALVTLGCLGTPLLSILMASPVKEKELSSRDQTDAHLALTILELSLKCLGILLCAPSRWSIGMI